MNKQQLETVNQDNFPNNTTGYISPLLLRQFNTDMIDNTVNQTAYNTDSSSVSTQLIGLNSYTQSLSTNFITSASLNAATQSLSASLAVEINNKAYSSSFNSFTQSTNGRLDVIETNYANKNAINTFSQNQNFTYDVNVGRNLNVTGKISVTGSFDIQDIFVSNSAHLGSGIWSTTTIDGFTYILAANELYIGNTNYCHYTESLESRIALLQTTASYLNTTFSTSVDSRLDNLESWSSSLDVTFATDAQLNYSSSVLQSNINTKLDTASFNSYSASAFSQSIFVSKSFVTTDNENSQSFSSSLSAVSQSFVGTNTTFSTSVNSRLTTIETTYAKTGSNTFTGTQTITGSANKLLIGDWASTTTYPAATVIVSNVSSSNVENHNIGVVGAGLATSGSSGTPTTGWGVGGYFKGWTNGFTRAGGVIGEGMVNAATDAGAAIGVRGYSNQIHTAGANIALYGDASGSSNGNYALYMNNGNIISNTTQTWTLPSSVTALNIGGLINFDTVTNNITISGSFNGFGQSISGSSVGNVVSASVQTTGSALTSSIDMSKGNFFTIVIPTGSVTLIKAININAGQTVAVRLVQQSPNTGSVRFDTPFKFWSGSAAYNTGSAIPDAVDIFTFVTFDTGSLYTSMIKNLV